MYLHEDRELFPGGYYQYSSLEEPGCCGDRKRLLCYDDFETFGREG